MNRPMELKKVTLAQLIPWADNPRSIDVKGIERLKRQLLRHKQYKPLVCRPAGEKYEILGGNMRYEALRQLVAEKLAVDEVWISVVHPKDEAEAIEYAMSDNDRIGKYDEPRLAKLIVPVMKDIDLEDYRIAVGDQLGLPELLSKYGRSMDVKQVELDENIKTAHKCQECGYRW